MYCRKKQIIDDNSFTEKTKKTENQHEFKSEKVIGKVWLQFGNSLRSGAAETFLIKTQSVDKS